VFILKYCSRNTVSIYIGTMATISDNDVLNRVNGTQLTGLNSMEIGKQYLVKQIERTYQTYGLRVIVTCDELKFILPESWNDRLTTDNINALMQCDMPLYVVYNGKIPLPHDKFKHDLKFTRGS